MPTRAEVLPSGLRLLVEPMPEMRSVAVGVWLDAGSRDDPPGLAGMAHFLEHLLFKGSSGRDARALAEAMDRLGGQFNAFTAKEHTCYHARVLTEHFAEGVELLADLVLRPRLRDEDVERERRVILAELAMVEDDPAETADELFARALWGEGGLGQPQAGTPEGVRACSAAHARGFYEGHYVATRTVVAVAGGMGADTVAEVLQAAFAHLPTGTARSPRPPARPTSRCFRLIRATEQAHLVIGTTGPALGDARRYALELLVSILGGSPSSRLFQAVREERGLCYEIGAASAAYSDAGEVAVFLAAPPSHMRQAATVTMEEIRRLARQGIPSGELQRHKDQLLAGLWMGLEGTEARMGRLGRLAVADQPIPSPEAVASALAAVQADELLQLANALGDPSTWAASYVGPRRGMPPEWRWEDAPEAASPGVRHPPHARPRGIRRPLAGLCTAPCR